MLHENSSTFASDTSANVFITIEFSFAAGRCDCLSIIYCKLRPVNRNAIHERMECEINQSFVHRRTNWKSIKASTLKNFHLRAASITEMVTALGWSQGPGVNSKRTLKWMARRGRKSFLYDFNPFGENLIFLSRSASTLRWINFASERLTFIFFSKNLRV